MKKLMTPVLAAGALLLAAGCGGSDATASGTTAAPSSTPSAVALTQADFSAKVQAALAARHTFQVVTTTTDEDGPSTFTTDVRVTGTVVDASGTGLDSTVVRVGDALYGRGEQLSDDPAKPWVRYDPASADPMAALTGAMLKLLGAQLDTHRVVGAAPYATKFSSAPGQPVDGVPTTLYTMSVDAPKAAAAKAFGAYLTADAVRQAKIGTLIVRIAVDRESLPRTFAFEAQGATVTGTFGKFGVPVEIAPPPAAQVA